MYTGPNTVNDGLVFGYDTGHGVADYRTSTRFFKGAPTINYIHSQNAVAQSSYTAYSATSSGNWNVNHPNAIRAYNAQGGDITSYINQGVGSWQNTHHAHWQYDPILKKPVVVMNDVDGQWKAKSFGTGLGSWTSQGKTHGSTYTISWLQWVDHLSKNAKAGLYTKNSSGGNGFHDGQANSASAYNTKLNTWQRVYQTYTTNSSRDLSETLASIYMYGHHNVRATVKIADVQFTWGSTPFPFSAEYERSSTKSLIDLKRTTDIDISNVSFDSTGQPDHDGTDDHITGVLPMDGLGAAHTIEMIFSSNVNQNGLGGRRDPFSIGNSSVHQYSALDVNPGNMNWYFYGRDTTFTNSPLMVANKFYHIVLSYAGGASNNTNKKVWLNGVQQTLSAGSSETPLLPNNPSFSVGRDRGRNTAYWPGEIPVWKVYQTAFTQGQALQNYNAYKNRFNI